MWTFCSNTSYSSRVDNEGQEMLNKIRDKALGPKDVRTHERGGVPLERYATGGLLKPVEAGARCYPLGLTYEKPTSMCAPNANSKTLDGRIDENTAMRAELMKVSVVSFVLRYNSQSMPGGYKTCAEWIRRSS